MAARQREWKYFISFHFIPFHSVSFRFDPFRFVPFHFNCQLAASSWRDGNAKSFPLSMGPIANQVNEGHNEEVF